MALEQEIAYFEKHLPEWVGSNRGKFVVVRGEELGGFFATPDDALAAGARMYGLESFLMRRIIETQPDVSAPALTLGILSAAHFSH